MLKKYIFAVVMSGFLISCGGDDDNGVKPDTTPPTVVSTNPAADAENVPLNINITAVFSERIDASTVNNSTFAVSGGIPGAVSVSDRTATFNPDNNLEIDQLYAVALTTGIKDMAGNALEANYSWQFTTAQVVLTEGDSYFPMADGDTWYYTNAKAESVVRVVSGDTVISGNTCRRILHNDETAEAWSKISTGDSAGAYYHLLTDSIYHFWFEPPLVIPFNMVYDAPYNYQSTAYWYEGDTLFSADISGTLKFKGYDVYNTPTGIHFDDVIKFFYIPEGYYEYYARNVGLLDNEDLVLDSAFVGGVWYHP